MKITNERLGWLAHYTDKVAEKAEGMAPNAKNAVEIAKANRDIATICRTLIDVRNVLDDDEDGFDKADRIRAIVGADAAEVIAVTNGHHWIKTQWGFVACRDCGIIRRSDDKNKPCKGPTTVGLRK